MHIRRRITAYLVVGGVLLGGSVVVRAVSWQTTSTAHTIMEVMATFLALFVGIIALVRFYSKKSNTYLFIGTGFLGTALLDGYHAIATFTPFSSAFPSLPPSLGPWSWIASRMFLSILLFLSWWAYRREERKGETGTIGEAMVYSVVGVLTLASFLFFALVPLPRAYYPELVVGRPEDVIPGLFFLLALVGYVRAGQWKRDPFAHYLVLSIMTGLAAQVAYMTFSYQLFDAFFNMAHLVKHASYVFVLIGLLISMYHLFRQADESVQEIRATNEALQSEIAARDQAERALQEAHDELEVRVEERTAALSKANTLLKQEVAERKKAEAALEAAKEAAEAANRAKSGFLANMSHELRTPLNGILGYAQILQRDDALTDTHHASIAVIKRSGEHLLTLINDILDLSKIEAGKLEVQPAEFHLIECLRSLTDIVRIRAEQKGLAFIYKMLSPLPDIVLGDERRLRQVLLNLLGNAVKFTEEGDVSLKVGYREATSEGAWLCFQVEDTGIGIAPEKLEEIFQPFQQVRTKDGPAQGTGLGLSISRRLVALMGGTLQVKSTPDQGSVFWFELDLPALEALVVPASEEERTVVGFEGPTRTILVVDDKPENRSVLMGLLAPLGFDLMEAGDGQEALEHAAADRPDLILMDLVMPVLDGFEATRRLRQTPALETIPVIALSASVFEYTRQQSIGVGCDDFIPKPIRIDVLLDKLKTHLGLEWIYSEGALSADRTPGATPPAEGEAVVEATAEEATALYELAMQGDIQGLLKQLDDYEHLNAPNHPFGSRLRELARGYRMEQIRELIKPYLERTL